MLNRTSSREFIAPRRQARKGRFLLIYPNLGAFASLRESLFGRFRNPNFGETFHKNMASITQWTFILLGIKKRDFLSSILDPRLTQVRGYFLDEYVLVNRLGDIAGTPGSQRFLPIALHRV
jgi:hypothetical protein